MTNTNNVQTKKGFTMIELIFVIVIIGILASVAIPRLAATRDDAKIATALSETGMILRETTAYYTANGHFEDTASKMSNVSEFNLTSGNVDSNDAIFTYYTPKNGSGTEACVDFKIYNTDGNVTISDSASNATPSGNVCRGIRKSNTFKIKLTGSHAVGGSNVSF